MSTDDCEETGIVVYTQGDNDEKDDVWDDTALIKMYEEAISETYVSQQHVYIAELRSKLASRKALQKMVDAAKKPQQSKSKADKETLKSSEPVVLKNTYKWKVGDSCMAPYYDDNLWYPATITRLDVARGECEVLYDFYDDSAVVEISDLTKQSQMRKAVTNVGQENSSKFGKTLSHCKVEKLCRNVCSSHVKKKTLKISCGKKHAKRPGCKQSSWKASVQYPSYFVSATAEAVKCDSAVSYLPGCVYQARLLSGMKDEKNMPEAAEDASLSQDTDEPASLEDSHPHPWETNKHDPDSSSHSVSSAYAQIPRIGPPPPPGALPERFSSDEKLFSNLLLSWYMTGYHTGYYQCLTEQKKKASERKK